MKNLFTIIRNSDGTVFGFVLIGILLAVIAWMIWYNLKMVREECIKENHENFNRRVQEKAEAMYRRKLKSTKFNVIQKMKIVNESDIDWGDFK
jgi:E3 ubiquitin-protein ligase DOA10